MKERLRFWKQPDGTFTLTEPDTIERGITTPLYDRFPGGNWYYSENVHDKIIFIGQVTSNLPKEIQLYLYINGDI